MRRWATPGVVREGTFDVAPFVRYPSDRSQLILGDVASGVGFTVFALFDFFSLAAWL
jgi:hypothetical protein